VNSELHSIRVTHAAMDKSAIPRVDRIDVSLKGRSGDWKMKDGCGGGGSELVIGVIVVDE
jgi:hypothetical protein